MRTSTSTRWLALLALSLVAAISPAQVGDDAAVRAALAPTGTLRAVFLATNPMQGRVDAETREVTGPAADIVDALAERLGLPATIQPVPGVPAVIEAVESASADIGFLAYDATRAEQVAFTQAYILGHNSYIVRADSPIRTLVDADRSGVRIGVRDGIAVDLYLSRTLQSATLLHLPRETTEAQATRLVLTGEIDAYAANTERLAIAATIEPDIRIIDGSLVDAEQSIVVMLGNATGVAFLDRFLDEARASGFLQSLVERHALAGVSVAPKATR